VVGKSIRVLIADDHDIVRDALGLVMSGFGPEVEILAASNFSEAVELASRAKNLDLAVLDLGMPDMPGMAGIDDFNSRFPRTPVVILSGYYRYQDVVEAFRHGAAGFVPKTLNGDAMLNAFRLVLSGEKYIPADLLEGATGDRNDFGKPGASGTNVHSYEDLTGREGEVLENISRGLSNKEIARELGIEEVTVKLHLRNVYRKLGAKNRAHAVQIAHQRGWHFKE
jgi:two-component system, NarL family, nitrate/nitrite response regulator NarL